MKSTFNICFYAKKDKQKANGAYPLFARITVDGVASRFNTKLDVLPSIWDGKMGKATGRTSEASRINRMLDDINASLNTIYHEMQRRDNYVTAEKVKNEFLGHSESHETWVRSSTFQRRMPGWFLGDLLLSYLMLFSFNELGSKSRRSV